VLERYGCFDERQRERYYHGPSAPPHCVIQ
jgi:hypothetical protein